VPPVDAVVPAAGPARADRDLLLLKAFAGGSAALTGVEAIANGVRRQAARGEERREHDDRDVHLLGILL
jgi:hypothetical protein